jgi:hypothetical protein
MKRLAIGVMLVAVGAAAGCGSKTPTTPSDTTTFNVQMTPQNEVPPVTNAESVARGTAVITIHKSTNTVDFNVTVNSFPAGSSLTAAHIHPGAAGVGGSVLLGTGLTAGNAPAIVNGSASFSFTGVSATADQVSQILAAPQNFYFNVHTAANGPGVMRGQLK